MAKTFHWEKNDIERQGAPTGERCVGLMTLERLLLFPQSVARESSDDVAIGECRERVKRPSFARQLPATTWVGEPAARALGGSVLARGRRCRGGTPLRIPAARQRG